MLEKHIITVLAEDSVTDFEEMGIPFKTINEEGRVVEDMKKEVELYKAFGEKFVPLHTGMKFEF
ncbi:MAG: hypothetical protein IMW83_06335 [Caldanaerobacter subterraneus]|nr:hypothetical protein [Caldanaerobacter subterraneus]